MKQSLRVLVRCNSFAVLNCFLDLFDPRFGRNPNLEAFSCSHFDEKLVALPSNRSTDKYLTIMETTERISWEFDVNFIRSTRDF
jgi:hypothetical protein